MVKKGWKTKVKGGKAVRSRRTGKPVRFISEGDKKKLPKSMKVATSTYLSLPNKARAAWDTAVERLIQDDGYSIAKAEKVARASYMKYGIKGLQVLARKYGGKKALVRVAFNTPSGVMVYTGKTVEEAKQKFKREVHVPNVKYKIIGKGVDADDVFKGVRKAVKAPVKRKTRVPREIAFGKKVEKEHKKATRYKKPVKKARKTKRKIKAPTGEVRYETRFNKRNKKYMVFAVPVEGGMWRIKKGCDSKKEAAAYIKTL